MSLLVETQQLLHEYYFVFFPFYTILPC